MNFATAGIQGELVEKDQAALDRGLATIRKNYENTAKREKQDMRVVDERMARIQGTTDMKQLADVDAVIEAVFEDIELKKDIFRQLDAVTKPGCFLFSNTSALNVD